MTAEEFRTVSRSIRRLYEEGPDVHIIPDPIERGEASCESWDAKAHVDGDNYRCDCGKIFDINEGVTLSPDPYAIPVCPDCFEEWEKETKNPDKSC